MMLYDHGELRSNATPDGLYRECIGMPERKDRIVLKVEGKFYWVSHPRLKFMEPVDPLYFFATYQKVEEPNEADLSAARNA